MWQFRVEAGAAPQLEIAPSLPRSERPGLDAVPPRPFELSATVLGQVTVSPAPFQTVALLLFAGIYHLPARSWLSYLRDRMINAPGGRSTPLWARTSVDCAGHCRRRGTGYPGLPGLLDEAAVKGRASNAPSATSTGAATDRLIWAEAGGRCVRTRRRRELPGWLPQSRLHRREATGGSCHERHGAGCWWTVWPCAPAVTASWCGTSAPS